MPAATGQQLEIAASSPSVFGGLSGACTTSPLDPIESVVGQPHGMIVIDPVGRLLATGSGHSHTDGFGHSVELPADPDFAPNGICAASSDVGAPPEVAPFVATGAEPTWARVARSRTAYRARCARRSIDQASRR